MTGRLAVAQRRSELPLRVGHALDVDRRVKTDRPAIANPGAAAERRHVAADDRALDGAGWRRADKVKHDVGAGMKACSPLDERAALAQIDQCRLPAGAQAYAGPADGFDWPTWRSTPLDYFSIHVDEARLN